MACDCNQFALMVINDFHQRDCESEGGANTHLPPSKHPASPCHWKLNHTLGKVLRSVRGSCRWLTEEVESVEINSFGYHQWQKLLLLSIQFSSSLKEKILKDS